jgi:hypothetical protein
VFRSSALQLPAPGDHQPIGGVATQERNWRLPEEHQVWQRFAGKWATVIESLDTMRKYVRDRNLFRDNPAAKLGL